MEGSIRIGIIGGGFCGMSLAMQLVFKAKSPISIHIFETREQIGPGIAYMPFSQNLLLNVPVYKMSLLPDDSNHYLEWLAKHPDYQSLDKELIGISYTPRYLYGQYLIEQWQQILTLAKNKQVEITHIPQRVDSIKDITDKYQVSTDQNQTFDFDHLILATGNQLPRNPKVNDSCILSSSLYYQNPWSIDSVSNLNHKYPIFILGNGLTMVDSVLGLLENGFKNKIYSLSPNGYNILPHRHNGMVYKAITTELRDDLTLKECVKIIKPHIKKVRKLGITAEPIVDQIRPFTQKIWANFSESDKQNFLYRYRHLWGVARHRIPLQIHDKIQQLRINGNLSIISGKIMDISKTSDELLQVTYWDNKLKSQHSISVGRIINCTGPDSDLSNLPPHDLLYKLYATQQITQDKLKLGISTDTSNFLIRKPDQSTHRALYTLGSNLRGELWESTAINELRNQALNLADYILTKS